MAGLSQAAATLGCSVETIRRRIKTGEIQATKVSGVWDIDLPAEATEPLPVEYTDATNKVIELLEGQVLDLQKQLAVKDQQIFELHQMMGVKALESATRSRKWWKPWGR